MLLIYSLVSKIRNGNRQHTMSGDDARVENVDGAFVEHQRPALIFRSGVASSNVRERRSIVCDSISIVDHILAGARDTARLAAAIGGDIMFAGDATWPRRPAIAKRVAATPADCGSMLAVAIGSCAGPLGQRLRCLSSHFSSR
jgi:hypothetical protein